MIKKLILADFIAFHFIDLVVDNPAGYPGFVSILAMIGYSLQIYGDFSGYTDIAIGVSRLMGFRLLENFNSPYKATSVADFWRRWHKSLGSWLRDYLYIPLGGNRSGGMGTFIATFVIFVFLIFITQWYSLIYIYVALMVVYAVVVRAFPKFKTVIYRDMNLLITMVIGGLWHGASTNFVIWGAMNGLALIFFNHWKKIDNPETKSWIWSHTFKLFLILSCFLAIYLVKNGFVFDEASLEIITYSFVALLVLIIFGFMVSKMSGKVQNAYRAFWGIFITFNFITFTRIWFRMETEEGPMIMLNHIWHHFDLSWDLLVKVLYSFQSVFWIMLAGFIIHWLPDKVKNLYERAFRALPIPVQSIAVAVMVFFIYQATIGVSKPFVYFQF